MRIRQVTLNEGPSDGLKSMASHSTAICSGEVYVWDGGQDEDHFTHALTLMCQLPEAVRKAEKDQMRELVMRPTPELWQTIKDQGTIPDWRINMWVALFQNGTIK